MLSRTRFFVLGLIACLVAWNAAAQDPPAPVPAGPRPFHDPSMTACPLFDTPGDPVSLVGLTENVSAGNAPVPANDSERLLFRQMYETLVRVGCDLTIEAGLATAWQTDATAAAWLLTLRQDARFADGTPVTAGDVITSWTRGGAALSPEVVRIVRTVTAVDNRTLRVVLQEEHRGVGPLTGVGRLADPALAIARPSAGSVWPLGTRDVRVDGSTIPPSGSRATIVLLGISAAPVRFLVMPARDGRDLLDQGVDLLVTREPAALRYAAALKQYDGVPLPWSRSYVFLSRVSGPPDALPPLLRQRLADDAVPGEARGSSYDWPLAWDSCPAGAVSLPGPAPQPPGTNRSRRIVYDQADAVARALGERIVVLAAARTTDSDQMMAALIPGDRSRKLQAAALPGAVLPAALARGDDAGYLVPLDTFTGCPDLVMLRQQAPWLTRDTAVPLVDTRSRAVVRQGRAHLTMEWDGTLRIAGSPAQ